jgi:hypothetical protein
MRRPFVPKKSYSLVELYALLKQTEEIAWKKDPPYPRDDQFIREWCQFYLAHPEYDISKSFQRRLLRELVKRIPRTRRSGRGIAYEVEVFRFTGCTLREAQRHIAKANGMTLEAVIQACKRHRGQLR